MENPIADILLDLDQINAAMELEDFFNYEEKDPTKEEAIKILKLTIRLATEKLRELQS